jgi:hypothetical protein
MLALHVIMTEFESFIRESGVMEKKLYEEAGLSHRTWKKRVTEPWDLSAKEVVSLAKTLRIDSSELFLMILKDLVQHRSKES